MNESGAFPLSPRLTPQPPDHRAALILAAREGCETSLGELLDGCRQYLLLIANAELNPGLQAKVGASDLVQETFLNAQSCFDRFEGHTHDALLAWLRTILLRKLVDIRRRYEGTHKRQLGRELPLESLADHARPVVLSGQGTTQPLDQLVCAEDARRMQSVLEQLPDDYRQILELRHRHNLSFAQIAVLMDRSSEGCRMLWRRAVHRLSSEVHAAGDVP